jgi:hypothetical protein
MSDSPVSPEDIRAAAETYHELGPEYHDAVVASFLQKVDREVAARVEARLAETAAAQPPKRKRRGTALGKRRVLRDVAAASAGALAVVGVVAAVGVQHASSAAPTRQAQILRKFPGAPGVIIGRNGNWVVVPAPPAPPAPPKG